jgi:Ca2+-binding RTX toxin-like protein
VAVGGAGKDVLIGGAGNDVFEFTATSLGVSDILRGGLGSDRLVLTTAGTLAAGGVGGVESYTLAGTGANRLSLANSNFDGVAAATITVYGGAKGNTIDGHAATGTKRLVAVGGAGADTLVAGRLAALKGGAGNDRFELTTPGSTAAPANVTIGDFAHGADKIGLGETGFGLGSSPAAATLFKANATGAFTTAAQRFAYNTASGALYFDHDGSGGASPRQLITSLTGHPTLAATDLFFFAGSSG